MAAVGAENESRDSDAPADRSHILVLVDGADPAGDGRPGGQLAAGPQGLLGVTVLQIGGSGDLPADRSLRLRVTDTDLLTVAVDRVGQEVTTLKSHGFSRQLCAQ